MNVLELGEKMRAGLFFIVGEVRAATAERSGYVDRKTGTSMKTIVRKYFVERNGPMGFEMVKITGKVGPEVTEPEQACLGVEIGKVYAFAIEHFERKAGFIMARMGAAQPEEIEGAAPPSGAPSGAPDGGAAS